MLQKMNSEQFRLDIPCLLESPQTLDLESIEMDLKGGKIALLMMDDHVISTIEFRTQSNHFFLLDCKIRPRIITDQLEILVLMIPEILHDLFLSARDQ